MVASTVTLILQRCAQIIEQTAVQNLTDALAVQRVTYVTRLLRMLAPVVEAKSSDLRGENQSIRLVLSGMAEVLCSQEVLYRNAAKRELLERLMQELKNVEVESLGICEENHELKEVLVQTINCLDILGEDLPEEITSSLRNQIRSVLREQLDRGIACTRSGTSKHSEPLSRPLA